MGPLKPQNSVNRRRHTFNFLVLGNDMIPLLCFEVFLQIHSGPPMFYHMWKSTAEKPLLLHNIAAKLYIFFHACPFVLICKLLWHPQCTNFVMPEASWMMEYKEPQLMSNLSAIISSSMNSFNTVQCL